MAIPLIPIIMAVASLGMGVAQGISSAKQSKEQASESANQTQNAINERARKAKKLINEQKTSFLKSGVYFDGTPELIIDETYDTATKDMQDIAKDGSYREKALIRQGRTGFYTGVVKGIMGAGASFMGMGGVGATANSLKIDTTNFQNWYAATKGLNKGGFGASQISGTEIA